MPKRLAVVEVPTPSAQGEDSWVKVRKLTVEDKAAAHQQAQALMQEALDMEAQAKSADTDGADPFLAIRAQKESMRLQADVGRLTLERFKAHIIEWNWVDEAGEPLPQVKDDPAVLDTLLDNEVKALNAAIGAADDAIKN